MKNTLAPALARINSWAEQPVVFLLSRVLFGSFVFVTAFYLLLYYVPYTRHMLFDWNVVPILNVFAKRYAIVCAIALLPIYVSLIPQLLSARTRKITVAFIVLTGSTATFLFFNPILAKPPEDERTFVWALLSVLPLLWVALLDWQRCLALIETDTQGQRLDLSQVTALALSVSLIFLAVFALRYGTGGFTRTELCLLAVLTFVAHFAVFAVVFAAFRFSTAISRKITRSQNVEFVIRAALVAVAAAVVLRKVVFVQISFMGGPADVVAVAFSVAFISYISVSLRRFSTLRSYNSRARGYLVFASPFARLALRIGLIAALAVFAYTTSIRLQGVDWNGLLQQMSVLFVWLASAIVFRAFSKSRHTANYSWRTLGVVMGISLAIFVGLHFGKRRLELAVSTHAPAISLTIDRYAGYDPSFALTGQILAPAAVDVFETTDDDPFFAMLRQNTNIPPEAAVTPVDVNLAASSGVTLTKKPHIFIFVIDSLRQDYLSPYNPSVQFTPNIAAFADESTVMRNAFTRYGGTALAEPSIWTGSMQLHKQFVQPFYPMNSLQKLIDAEHYTSFITIDPILKSILKSFSDAVELDRGGDWKDYDFVETLADLQAKLSTRRPERIFAYSQPQNLHLVSLQHTRRQFSREARYAGFEPQHAFEVERIDKAFGEFVQFLKSSGLYDDSIIVLTSDHGDALGEEGHWGHGNSLYPEVIRIPLLIHLPKAMATDVVSEPGSIAFSTDITPTIYYLMGRRPIVNSELFGRPLFTETLEEQKQYRRDSYLIVDSYGPVYGMLSGDAKQLFVADATTDSAYIYDLTRGYAGRRVNVTSDQAEQSERTVAREVQKIQSFYHFYPAQRAANTTSPPNLIAQIYSLLFSK
ncbi:MAG TPA: sulfatase-like hydrolase/transferase [Pyrinomonadaceae bacterium]|nr:sulfatase-like hydrolase/transferase [Pyrinomonadaceae bacterium]